MVLLVTLLEAVLVFLQIIPMFVQDMVPVLLQMYVSVMQIGKEQFVMFLSALDY